MLFLSFSCLTRYRCTKRRQGRVQQIFSIPTASCPHVVCCSHSQRTRESLRPSSSPSSIVSTHLLTNTKAQKTFQKNGINNKTNIAQNLVNRKPVEGEQVHLIATWRWKSKLCNIHLHRLQMSSSEGEYPILSARPSGLVKKVSVWDHQGSLQTCQRLANVTV